MYKNYLLISLSIITLASAHPNTAPQKPQDFIKKPFSTMQVATLQASMSPYNFQLYHALNDINAKQKAVETIDMLHAVYEKERLLERLDKTIATTSTALKKAKISEQKAQLKNNLENLHAQYQAYETAFGTLNSLYQQQFTLQKQLHNILWRDREQESAEFILERLYWAERNARGDLAYYTPGFILWLKKLMGR